MLLALKKSHSIIEVIDRIVDNTPDISEMKEIVLQFISENKERFTPCKKDSKRDF